jgi:hypothetical protein
MIGISPTSKSLSKTDLNRYRAYVLYHLVVNTDRVAPPQAAELIAHAARQCFATTIDPLRTGANPAPS